LVAFQARKTPIFSTRYAGKDHLRRAVSLQVQFDSLNKVGKYEVQDFH